MKVVRYYAPGDIRVEESSEPQPAPGEVTVRVRACSVCGTDLKISRYGHHRIVPPRVLGHEIAGEVADLITHRLPLSRFPEALETLARGDAIKVTIEAEGTSV